MTALTRTFGRLGHAALLGLVLVASNGCESGYPLPPTACDDYCRATQRGACDDDSPADCVRDCEANADAMARDDCGGPWRARDDCLLHLDPGEFTCDNGNSRLPDACLAERRAVAECLATGTGFCFDECVRQAQECGAKLPDCEHDCLTKSAACRPASNDFARCLQDFPVDCGDASTPDPPSPEEPPCFNEALAVLACGG